MRRDRDIRLASSLAATALLLVLGACGGDDPSIDPTDDGGGGGGCPDNPTASVPEDLRCLWELTYEGCRTSEGRQGRQLHWIMEGQVDADGNITGEERFWWFFPEEWNTPDCVDTLTMSGSTITTDLAQLGCASCEEGYSTVREVTQNSCNLGYGGFFDEDQEGYRQTLLVDTLNANGEPNEDNNILVLTRTTGDGGGASTDDYARGTMTPLGDTHGPPYSFTWIGSACRGR